jgi:hypothetical protein
VNVTASNVTHVDVTATSPATGATETEPLTNLALPAITGSAMVGQIIEAKTMMDTKFYDIAPENSKLDINDDLNAPGYPTCSETSLQEG